LETTNEELQSTVEELETTNEELQSTNEELETMNEELQSTNEELQTMNDELRNRSTELNSSNAFLEAVFTSLRSAVVVLDRDLRVHVWNAGALDMWGLRPDEAQGTSFFTLDIGLPVGELHQPIRDILSGAAMHREITLGATNRKGKRIRCHVSVAPLVGSDRAVTGVILLMEEAVEG
jgi:two-component system CheB/CheR fusion protein